MRDPGSPGDCRRGGRAGEESCGPAVADRRPRRSRPRPDWPIKRTPTERPLQTRQAEVHRALKVSARGGRRSSCLLVALRQVRSSPCWTSRTIRSHPASPCSARSGQPRPSRARPASGASRVASRNQLRSSSPVPTLLRAPANSSASGRARTRHMSCRKAGTHSQRYNPHPSRFALLR